MNQLKQAIIDRYEEMVKVVKQGIDENLAMANLWGRLHICLGISTALFSSISAVFTFFEGSKIIVVILALISTLLASCLTFLNPSNREAKRRATANLYLIEYNHIKASQIIINHSSLSEDEMIHKLQELSSRVKSLAEESIKLMNSGL